MLIELPFIVQGFIMFFCQLVFIGFRTLNVRYNSELNRLGVFWTGIFVHIAWLATLYIGLGQLFKGNPAIILFSLSGGLIGADWALRFKKNQLRKRGEG